VDEFTTGQIRLSHIVPVVTGSPDWNAIGQIITLVTNAYGHHGRASPPSPAILLSLLIPARSSALVMRPRSGRNTHRGRCAGRMA
jgi:hypothetical protein